MADNTGAMATDSLEEPINKNKRYRKPKPWDTDDIDHVLSSNPQV
jgi:hypothetical protein